MKQNTFLITSLLLALIVSGCDTTSAIKEPVKYTRTASIRIIWVPARTGFGPKITDNMMEGSLEQAPEESTFYNDKKVPKPSPFGCHRTWVNPDPEYKYRIYTNFIYFPEAYIKAANNKYKYVVSKALSPDAPDGKIMGMARCIVPNLNHIDKMIESFVKMHGNKNSPDIQFKMETQSWIMNSEYNIDTNQ